MQPNQNISQNENMSIESSPYKKHDEKKSLDFLRKNPPWNWRSHLKNAGDSFPFGVFWSVVQERLLLVSGECNLSAFHVHFETEIQDERCLKRGPRAGSSKKLGMRTRGEIHISRFKKWIKWISRNQSDCQEKFRSLVIAQQPLFSGKVTV